MAMMSETSFLLMELNMRDMIWGTTGIRAKETMTAAMKKGINALRHFRVAPRPLRFLIILLAAIELRTTPCQPLRRRPPSPIPTCGR